MQKRVVKRAAIVALWAILFWANYKVVGWLARMHPASPWALFGYLAGGWMAVKAAIIVTVQHWRCE